MKSTGIYSYIIPLTFTLEHGKFLKHTNFVFKDNLYCLVSNNDICGLSGIFIYNPITVNQRTVLRSEHVKVSESEMGLMSPNNS